MNKKSFILIVLLALILVGCKSQKIDANNFSDIQKDKIQNAFLEVLKDEVGYTDKISEVMTKEIYNSINMGNNYTNYTKINSEIVESKVSSKYDEILLYLSVNIEVMNGKEKISEAWEIPIVLTIKENSSGYSIEKKQEYLSKNDIPEEFK